MVVGNNELTTTQNAGKLQIAGNFDCNLNAAVRRGAHCPMEHIYGFTRSCWIPPSSECLRLIAPAAAMVDKFEGNTQNTNKTQLLASNYDTVHFVYYMFMRILGPKTDSLISSLMQQASFKCETPRLES